MFLNPPRILAHKSAIALNHFYTKDRIITSDFKAYGRTCPHKYYPIGEEGQTGLNITCELHGYQFCHKYGLGTNNTRKLKRYDVSVGPSGLICENFIEPVGHWAWEEIKNTSGLKLRNVDTGSSTGSWLWNMDMEVDIMHLREGGIHPWLAANYTTDQIELEEGDGWCLQKQWSGFWLLVYPFTFIEWTPGLLCVKTVTPNDINNEFGFTWLTQIYWNDGVDITQAWDFMKLKDVYNEDVEAIEKIDRPYRPQLYSDEPLEKQNVHFGQWVNDNKR